MFELRDEHRRHTVQSGAALGRHRLQRGERIEALAEMHHRGTMCGAGEIAQHHAEAVIQRHWDAEPVLGRQLHRLADEEAVVEDAVMRQRRALRRTSGARGELDVDCIVELQLRPQFGQTRAMQCGAHRGHRSSGARVLIMPI